MEQVCNALYIAAGEAEIIIRQNESGEAEMGLDNSSYQKTKRFYNRMEQLQETMLAGDGQSEDEWER